MSTDNTNNTKVLDAIAKADVFAVHLGYSKHHVGIHAPASDAMYGYLLTKRGMKKLIEELTAIHEEMI